MPKKTDRKPNILFLFADTGGGHRSAAEAIIEAINLEFPNQFTMEMVDFFKSYSPPPLNLAGPTYPAMSKMTYMWEWMFKGSDDVDTMRRVYATLWPYIRLPIYRLIREHPCDMIIAVHPLVNEPILRGLKNKKISLPYLVVVTDLVSTHVAWFNNKVSEVIVPTPQAATKARLANLSKEKIRVIGLPVADNSAVQLVIAKLCVPNLAGRLINPWHYWWEAAKGWDPWIKWRLRLTMPNCHAVWRLSRVKINE
jgi:1,2-diacylglycerol 3-beta-galactosyltransferase